jgi:hypothetical protein
VDDRLRSLQGCGEFQCGLFYYCILNLSTQSLKVRSNYINHLRDLGIIETHFIPTVFSLLKLYDGLIKTFKLDIWSVEEYHVDRKNTLLL